MTQRAYICLTDDNVWAIAAGDGSEQERQIIAVGEPFDERRIREAVGALEAWADANGYTLMPPDYSLSEWSLTDLIEPEVFDQVFGDDE